LIAVLPNSFLGTQFGGYCANASGIPWAAMATIRFGIDGKALYFADMGLEECVPLLDGKQSGSSPANTGKKNTAATAYPAFQDECWIRVPHYKSAVKSWRTR
jgi:hypothetical protein